MQSTSPIGRQWQILIALMSRRLGMTIKELSHDVGVDDRTIRRDLTTLRRAGFLLEERITDYGRKHWSLSDSGPRVPIQFNWSEAVALYLGRHLLDPLAGTHFWHSAQTAFAKIRAMLGEASLKELEKVSQSFLQTIPGRSDYSEKADLIDSLMLAIEDHRIAFVAYQSERSTEPVSLELYPYGIVYHKGSLYLVAYSRDHETQESGSRKASIEPTVELTFHANSPNATTRKILSNSEPNTDAHKPATPAIRHFKVDRVTEVDVQSLQFTPNPDFNLQHHLTNSFGIYQAESGSTSPAQRIRIRFHSEAARYVQEKTWHASQNLTKQKDGSVILEVDLNNSQEIKAWALSFGPRATILEPQSLKEEIQRDIETMLSLYEPSDKPTTNRIKGKNKSP